jgi:hypothetical protein
MDAKSFPSKIDSWLLIVFAVSALACLIGASLMLAQGVVGGLMVAPLMLSIGIGLPTWLLLTTDYRFEGKTLIVRGGPFRWRIRVHEINTVRPTHNSLSSPALSLDRLRIEYGDGKALMISPRDADTFISELQARGGPPLCTTH